MSISEVAELLLGATIGVAILFAALVASTASIRAGESWESEHRIKATAFASFAGVSGVAAVAGIVYGIFLVILHSPLAG
ncbi:MAG TPA: hypothetical protein VD766_12130 [Solirubrobacterales bacterium]|nr:hypothetical protein [Solirubrobacterales bacterium]